MDRTTIGLWRATGLESTESGLSSVYSSVVYLAYACLCAASAADMFQGRAKVTATTTATGGRLQILVIRDVHMALLFVATTAVYWCAAVYRRQHARVRDLDAAIARSLFGAAESAGGAEPVAQRACRWSLYGLLVAVLSLDAFRSADVVAIPWTHRVAFSWSHYALLTGHMQFAGLVSGLLRYYRELNERMRPGGGGLLSRSSVSVYGLLSTVLPVLDRVDSLTMLKYWSDMHWSITQIVSRINKLFKFRLFIFFLCGLLHLMLTPYLLSLTILNANLDDVLLHVVQRVLWFVLHIFRVVLVIYPCALLGEEAAKTQILLGIYLNTKLDYFDIKKIETYAQQLEANKPEFSIYSMFVINRQLVITLSGAVATYLVIIIQLQGQS